MDQGRALVRKTLEAVLACQEAGDFTSLPDSLDSLITPRSQTLICKLDDDEQMAYGWASVATVDGVMVLDRQDDEIAVPDLREMAHDFIGKRVVGELHQRTADIGEVRESIVFDKRLQDALGIDLGREGWFIGVHVRDRATWDRVKSGELGAFSIAG